MWGRTGEGRKIAGGWAATRQLNAFPDTKYLPNNIPRVSQISASNDSIHGQDVQRRKRHVSSSSVDHARLRGIDTDPPPLLLKFLGKSRKSESSLQD